MEDVTDTVFRRVVASTFPPDVYFTEFVSCDGLCSAGHDAVAHRLDYTEEERPIVAQIWGTSPERFYRAAGMIRALGFDGIDINMGCPVKKIVRNGACAALIDDPPLAAELVDAAREGAAPLPVSVKTRIGFREKKTEEWAAFLLDLQPALLTVHGRTARDMSDVPADWNEVRKVVELRNAMGSRTIILGNGDVVENRQLEEFPSRYGVDGVMVGRGVFHDLFIFRRSDSGDPSPPFADLPSCEKLSLYRRHIALHREAWGNEKNFNVVKKFAKTYVSGFSGAAKLRTELMEACGYEEMLTILASAASEQSAIN